MEIRNLAIRFYGNLKVANHRFAPKQLIRLDESNGTPIALYASASDVIQASLERSVILKIPVDESRSQSRY
jgi:hypothetical protein